MIYSKIYGGFRKPQHNLLKKKRAKTFSYFKFILVLIIAEQPQKRAAR